MKKEIPRGTWIHIANLQAGTTEQELSAWFQRHGLDVSEDCFSIKHYPETGRASALLSLPDELIPSLLGWIIGDDETFNGQKLVIRPWRNRAARPSKPGEAPLTPAYR